MPEGKNLIIAYDSKDSINFDEKSPDFPLERINEFATIKEVLLNTFLDLSNEDDEPDYKTYRETLKEEDQESEMVSWLQDMCMEFFRFKNEETSSLDEKLNILKELCFFPPLYLWVDGKEIEHAP